jgi:diphthamide biosynthesis methyltransferase
MTHSSDREGLGIGDRSKIIGLGFADEKNISVKGLEAVKSCTRLYLEAYTSMLLVLKNSMKNQLLSQIEKWWKQKRMKF